MEDRGRERRRKPRATKQQRSEKEGPSFYVLLLRMNFFFAINSANDLFSIHISWGEKDWGGELLKGAKCTV